MKLFVYSYRKFDEDEYFQKFSREYGVELGICYQGPSMENAHLAEGYDYISILTSKIDAALVRKFRELGIKMISTRTIGYDHIDLEAAKECGMKVSNVTYSPECVADYTMLLILMSIRNMKRICQRAEINDFSLPGIQGKELHNFTVGVIGTGKIGQAVIRDLSGFGCKIYAYDVYQAEKVKKYAEYVDNIHEIYYKDLKAQCLRKHDLSILRAFPNVVVTPHMAFYTDQAVSDMVKHSILSCCLNEQGEENPWEIKGES